MKIREMLMNLLFPPRCILCGSLLQEEETDLCRDCRTNTDECPISKQRKLPFLDSWLGVWYYEGKVRRSILRYKFRGARSYAGGYGRILAMKLLREHPEGFDMLTWVPVSALRRFLRGYDQVELLAHSVGRELGIEPVCLLKKVRHNRSQSSIRGDAQRRANVLGVYRVLTPDAVKDKKILLLDDVITTGSTAGECARVLLTAGCAEVHCGAVAVSRRGKKRSR